MKKTLLALTILAAFVLAGCGSEEKPKYDKNGNKIEYNEKGERIYKMPNKVKIGDGCTGEPLHQFKTDHK